MPIIESHPPGTFNWFELATTDQSAAKVFYSKLFGWEIFDSPMGPNEVYTTFRLEGKDAAAGYTMRPEMQAQGIPPHWDIYLAVESADETAAKIESAGGHLISKPFDVMDYGRMAVASDPAGAVFCIWQKKSQMGSGITAATGTVCWADLMTPDPEAATKFYSAVFGWELYKSPKDDSGYLHIKCGDLHIGGVQTTEPASWLLYFSAEDAEMLTNKASALGATTLVPLTEIPNTGKFSIVKDPQGAAFALFQTLPRSN
jgi:predicted enzyme related to lactoylglutathione lyase